MTCAHTCKGPQEARQRPSAPRPSNYAANELRKAQGALAVVFNDGPGDWADPARKLYLRAVHADLRAAVANLDAMGW